LIVDITLRVMRHHAVRDAYERLRRFPNDPGTRASPDWVEIAIQGSEVFVIMIWDEIYILIQRAQTGDREAFGELVVRFQPAVYAVALARLRDPNEATELAQEVFIHAMTKIAQLRDPHCFVGWLRQITVRMAINRVTRKAPVQGTEPEFLQNAPDDEGGPLDDMIQSENRTAVWNGLDRLKPLDRDTLVAFYIKGRSLKQMSREFETPVGTIKRRLHVARNRLKTALEKGTRRQKVTV
jgi:RNA polymerase sigma-70 factor (ECF subfamily)